MENQKFGCPGLALPDKWHAFGAEKLPFFDLKFMDLDLGLSGSPARGEMEDLRPENILLPNSPILASFVAGESEQDDMGRHMPRVGQVPFKRHRPKAAEWETMKPMIEELYIEKNKQFKDVAAALDAQFGFLPS